MDVNIKLTELYTDGVLKFTEYGESGQVIRNIIKNINVFKYSYYKCANFEVHIDGTCIFNEESYDSLTDLVVGIRSEAYLNKNMVAFIASIKLMEQNGSAGIEKFKTVCNNWIYKIVDAENKEATVVIPAEVKTTCLEYMKTKECIWDSKEDKYNIVKVMGGGPRLESLNGLFRNCKAVKIDMSQLDVKNVRSAHKLYHNAIIEELDLEWTNKCEITDMSEMFKFFRGNEIDLRKLNTKYTEDMCDMLSDIRNIKLIGIEGLDVSHVKYMTSMFARFNGVESGQSLKIESWDVHNVVGMSKMFSNCEVEILDISRWMTNSLNKAEAMFKNCKAKVFGISNLNMDKIVNAKEMFKGATLKDTNVIINSRLSYCMNTSDMFTGLVADSLDIAAIRCKVETLRHYDNMFCGLEVNTIYITAWDMLNEMSKRTGRNRYIDFTIMVRDQRNKRYKGHIEYKMGKQ